MQPSIKTIDTHAHYFPQSYIDLIAKHGKRCGTTVTVDDNGVTFIQVGDALVPLDRTLVLTNASLVEPIAAALPDLPADNIVEVDKFVPAEFLARS